NDYLDTHEPFDKAGAYGIQGYGSKFINKIDGCFFSVMGFPIPLFSQKMYELGYKL
ncbi:MAG: Maf family protein, partial [Candidatus Delongbacteria bacterium]|nr:Maf family protein [Candidatus Delongbacteria bacterium]